MSFGSGQLCEKVEGNGISGSRGGCNKKRNVTFINARFVLDLLGAISVAQGAHSFIKIVVSRAKVGNHDSFGVTTQTVLEQACELAVTIRYVACFGGNQCGNDITQC